MKKTLSVLDVAIIILIIAITAVSVGFYREVKSQTVVKIKSPLVETPTRSRPKKKLETIKKISSSLFVPYWTLSGEAATMEIPVLNDNNIKSPDMIIYFGIAPTLSGINTDEPGYNNLETFRFKVPKEAKTMLTIRMTQNDTTRAILEKESRWEIIMDKTIALAADNNFSGVVLDIELSALPTSKIVNSITRFVTAFAKKAKRRGLLIGVTAYGDSVYRYRPFNLAAFSRQVDMIYVMAYDFHKSFGTPGPNFPLAGKETYYYDMHEMTNDFIKLIPKEKITVIFGLYGYDWTVDEKKRPIKPAAALSLREIKKKFIDSCDGLNCVAKEDPLSAETEISYVDKQGRTHIVWFENEVSIEKKRNFLKNNGITRNAFWAWTYY